MARFRLRNSRDRNLGFDIEVESLEMEQLSISENNWYFITLAVIGKQIDLNGWKKVKILQYLAQPCKIV